MDRQIEFGKMMAKELKMGYQIHKEIISCSGNDNPNKRPGLTNLLRLIKKGVIKYVYAFDATRLSRNAVTSALILGEFKKAKVKLYTSSPKYDFLKEGGVLTSKILYALNVYETELRRLRFK